MPKSVRFSPSVAPPARLSPQDHAALIMLDYLHNGKRKFENTPARPKLVSPNDQDDDDIRNDRYIRDPALPAPPFMDDDSTNAPGANATTTTDRDATSTARSVENPLDLLSTVSVQLDSHRHYDESVQCAQRPPPPTTPAVDGSSTTMLRQGYKVYPNGSTYLGHFLNAQRHGFGICHYPDGHVYSGLWENGMRSGLGTMQYANGDGYEGLWREDTRHKGCLYYRGGMVDVGLWNGSAVTGVRWSAERECTWRVTDGKVGERNGREEALMIGRFVGVGGVPERMM